MTVCVGVNMILYQGFYIHKTHCHYFCNCSKFIGQIQSLYNMFIVLAIFVFNVPLTDQCKANI